MTDPVPVLSEFRSQVARRLGLWFEDHRQEFLAGILDERSAAHGRGPAGYLQWLAASDAREEWQALAGRLTVAETYFLRGADHFHALVKTVLPRCVGRPAGSRALRVLSAGCASGEEPYSIAISLRETPAATGGRPVEIVAVDVNPAMLARARAGRYSEWALRETPPEIRRRYFRASRSEFMLDESIVAMVAFRQLNLAEPNDDLWQPGAFDAIFCRNVLMYFMPETAAAVVGRIERALAPCGCLFLGHAETLRGLSQAFHLRRDQSAFYYELKDAAEDRSEPAGASRAAPSPRAAAAQSDPATAPEPSAATEWMDEISRASLRIANLAAAAPAASPAAANRAAGAHGWRRVLDLHQQERFTEALTHLQQLPAGAAPDTDLQILQAMLLVNCGRLAEAEDLCRPLLERDELNAAVHYVVALCREHAGDLAAAEEHDAAAAYLDPSFAMPRFHLGRLARQLGRTSDALVHLEAALTLLVKEDPLRLLLFGGGFSREALVQACRGEIRRLPLAP
ncbi:MAG TPA: CheR family methyltransferase [Opitutaceae bacterium]|nr:CheR family methyltransferase [Opitutaceae bacterium]